MVARSRTGRGAVTVLVVEDDEEQLFMACVTLGTRYPVLSAACGEDALRVARQARPTVIVLDVMMAGGMDGFTVFRALHDAPETRDIPVVFLTEVNRVMDLHFGPDELDAHLGVRPAAFLEKPVSADELLRVVTEVASTTGTK